MLELAVRIVAGLSAGAGAWFFRLPGAEVVAKSAAVFVAVSILVFLLERRGMRTESVAACSASVDSLLIALALAASSQLDAFGFLVLTPLVHAASRFGASPPMMAPLSAGSLVAAHTLLSKASTLGAPILIQAAAVLATGLLLNDRRIFVNVPKPVLPATLEPMAAEGAEEALELRESYRRLKEMYQDLDRQSRRDRNRVALADARHAQGERFFKRIATQLRELAGAESLALYSVAQWDQRLVVRATAGNYPESIRDVSIEVDLQTAAKQVSLQAFEALDLLIKPREQSCHTNVVLKHAGRIVGLACLRHLDPDRLRDAQEICEEVSESLAAMIVEEEERSGAARRAREAELLYELAHTIGGAKTPTHLAARALREVWDSLDLDHLGVFWIDGADSIAAAHEGKPNRFFESIRFSTGEGLKGWLALQAPELHIFDVRSDSRCPAAEATKQRIGSYALIPIQFGEHPYGFLAAATDRMGGLDLEALETLKRLVGELTHAIARILGEDLESFGMATPGELQQAIRDGAAGHLVYLEPHRRLQTIEHYGRAAFESALRQFSRRLKSKLPSGSLVTMRDEGDFVALLRGVSSDFAISWANEVSAMASFVGIATQSGDRVPLAMRAKVAPIGSQMNEISDEIVA